MNPSPAPRFTESGAPPPWLRVLLWVGLPVVIVAWGGLTDGADGAWAGVLSAVVVCIGALVPIELSVRQGHVRVVGDHLHVGRRAVPVDALDLATLRFKETAAVYRFLGKGQLKSNPIWLRHTVALDGHHEGHPVQVMVRTNHPDELVAALWLAAHGDEEQRR